MSSDERLVLRAARGDRRAFGEIYERYHQELYRFCLAMLGNAQDAQDTLQNTMVKALRGLRGEEREIRLKPWLYRIAHNEAVETLRKRRDTVELRPDQATTTGVIEVTEIRERLRALLADLEQLPERQRAVLVMRELSGLDFEQIGAAFGSSPAVARQTLYEARLSLRQLEAGREMRCQDVMRELSDGDGRVTRRREIRAHLRSCADCRAFRDQISRRREDLAGIAPLPIAASTGVLHAVLGGKVGSATGLAVTAGGEAGKAVATSAIVKSVATVAVVVAVGASADRSGLIHVPLPTHGQAPAQGVGGNGPTKDASSGGAAAATSSTGAARMPKHAIDHAVDRRPAPPESMGRSKQGSGVREVGMGAATPSTTGEPPGSTSGSNPPGGGYGRSSSSRRGRPEGRPDASARGQEKAAAHRAGGAAAHGGNASGDHRGGSGEAGAQQPEHSPNGEKAVPPVNSSPGDSGPPAASSPNDERAESPPVEGGPRGRQP